MSASRQPVKPITVNTIRMGLESRTRGILTEESDPPDSIYQDGRDCVSADAHGDPASCECKRSWSLVPKSGV